MIYEGYIPDQFLIIVPLLYVDWTSCILYLCQAQGDLRSGVKFPLGTDQGSAIPPQSYTEPLAGEMQN